MKITLGTLVQQRILRDRFAKGVRKAIASFFRKFNDTEKWMKHRHQKSAMKSNEDHNNKGDPKKAGAFQGVELILGNSNSRFSGVTSTMLQVLSEQRKLMNVVVLGNHHLPQDTQSINYWEFVKLTRKPLSDGRFRIFHARRINEMIVAWLARTLFCSKIKIVFTSTAQRDRSALTRWLIHRMDGIVSTCDAAADYLVRKPDVIIPHGIDTEQFRPTNDRAAAWKNLKLPGKYGIGIFGRVRKQKGIDILIDACLPLLSKYPDFTVVIVGEITPENRQFVQEQEKKVQEAGLEKQIFILGKQDFTAIPSLFSAMSIVTALSRNEGFGLTVLEAMSSKTAVIASQAGAWPDIIDDDVDGYCVPVDDIHSTQQALDKLMSSKELRASISEAARDKVLRNYTSQREARQLCDYFKTLM